MTDKKGIKAIIYYKDFLKLDENQIKSLLDNECVEFLISIKKDEYKNLSAEEKEKLYGFRRTETEPLKKPIIIEEAKIFEIHDLPETRMMEPSFKEKHRRNSKPYCPKNIFNKNYNSRKKGGR